MSPLSIFALVLLANVSVHALTLLDVVNAPREKCSDGSFCSGASHCCGDRQSAMCCQTGWPCCGDSGCCESDELACSDPVNGCVCCETQFTYCCAPNPALGIPSRCCPRGNVCCDDTTRFGCCSPGLKEGETERFPLPEAFTETRGGRKPRTPLATTSDKPRKAAKSLTAYGLLFSAWQGGNGMLGMTIDLNTGVYTSVPAPGFPTGGEIPHTFTWDVGRKLFHSVMTNWSTLIPPTQKRPVVMWTIDPVTGNTTNSVLAGVFGQSTGFAYVPDTQQMLLGTADIDANQTRVNAYHFWTVDVPTRSAKLIRTVPFPGGQDNYAGWFHNASPNGKFAYRLGNINPQASTSAFGITLTSTTTGVSTFNRVVPPANHARYESLTPVWSTNDFISLAPSTAGDPNSDLDCVRWSLTGSKVLAVLGNAHRTPKFGPIVETLSGNTYAAFVVQDSLISTMLDQWMLTTVDIASGASQVLSLSPFIDGQTDSVAGIGLA